MTTAAAYRTFTVDADRGTGAWIEGTLKHTGYIPTLADMPADTDDWHHDAAEINGETCYVVTHWVA